MTLRPGHATPSELRSRAKSHLDEWRRLLPFDRFEAQEELAKASTLSLLAGQAEAANDNSAKREAA